MAISKIIITNSLVLIEGSVWDSVMAHGVRLRVDAARSMAGAPVNGNTKVAAHSFRRSAFPDGKPAAASHEVMRLGQAFARGHEFVGRLGVKLEHFVMARDDESG